MWDRLRNANVGDDGPPRNVLLDSAPFTTLDRSGLHAHLAFARPEVAAFVFDLTKASMHDLCVEAWCGWSDAVKRHEVTDDGAR